MSSSVMPNWLEAIKLEIKLKGAILDRNTDMLDKMDPYCVIDFTRGGGAYKKSFRSQTHFGGHKEPKWDQFFVFFYGGEPKGSSDDKIKFTIFEEDLTSSD